MMHAIIQAQANEPVLPQFPPYGICLLESRHTSRFEMHQSRYSFYEVMLAVKGEGWIESEAGRHPLIGGDLLVVPSGTGYAIHDAPGQPLTILCLCVEPEPLAGFRVIAPPQFRWIRQQNLSSEIAAHLRAILFEQSHPNAESGAVVTAQTLLVFSKLARWSHARQPGVTPGRTSGTVEMTARVQDYIDQLPGALHQAETSEMVATRLGMSVKSFNNYFRTLMGTTRQRHLQQVRINHARELLRHTQEPITSIAFACGFDDLSTFFRAFRTEEGVSPAQWRSRWMGP